MTKAQIDENGQLKLPKRFRKELGLKVGARLAVLRLGDGLILLPEQRRFDQLRKRVRSTLMAAGLTAKEIGSTLPEARSRVYAHRYGYRPGL